MTHVAFLFQSAAAVTAAILLFLCLACYLRSRTDCHASDRAAKSS